MREAIEATGLKVKICVSFGTGPTSGFDNDNGERHIVMSQLAIFKECHRHNW
jgi:hypothetical protein